MHLSASSPSRAVFTTCLLPFDQIYWAALLKAENHERMVGRRPPPPPTPAKPPHTLFTCPTNSCKNKVLDAFGYCSTCRTHPRVGGGGVPLPLFALPIAFPHAATETGARTNLPIAPTALLPPPATEKKASAAAAAKKSSVAAQKAPSKTAARAAAAPGATAPPGATRPNHKTAPPPAAAPTIGVKRPRAATETGEAMSAATREALQNNSVTAALNADAPVVNTGPHPPELTQTERTDSVVRTCRIDNFPALAAKYKQRKFFVASSFHALGHNWFVDPPLCSLMFLPLADRFVLSNAGRFCVTRTVIRWWVQCLCS